MRISEQIVLLAGTWIKARFNQGNRLVLECETTPDFSRQAVRNMLGDDFDVSPYRIEQIKDGIKCEMMALPIGDTTFIWAARDDVN